MVRDTASWSPCTYFSIMLIVPRKLMYQFKQNIRDTYHIYIMNVYILSIFNMLQHSTLYTASDLSALYSNAYVCVISLQISSSCFKSHSNIGTWQQNFPTPNKWNMIYWKVSINDHLRRERDDDNELHWSKIDVFNIYVRWEKECQKCYFLVITGDYGTNWGKV